MIQENDHYRHKWGKRKNTSPYDSQALAMSPPKVGSLLLISYWPPNAAKWNNENPSTGTLISLSLQHFSKDAHYSLIKSTSNLKL